MSGLCVVASRTQQLHWYMSRPVPGPTGREGMAWTCFTVHALPTAPMPRTACELQRRTPVWSAWHPHYQHAHRHMRWALGMFMHPMMRQSGLGDGAQSKCGDRHEDAVVAAPSLSAAIACTYMVAMVIICTAFICCSTRLHCGHGQARRNSTETQEGRQKRLKARRHARCICSICSSRGSNCVVYR